MFAKGLCERIGIDGRLTHKVPAKDAKYEFEIPMPTHSEAIQAVLDALLDAGHGVIKSASEIDAVGHRVVHGGEKFASSVRITDEVMAALEAVSYTHLDVYKRQLSPCAERPSRLPAVEVLLLLGGEGVDGQAHGGQLDPADGVVDFGGHLVDLLLQAVPVLD